MSYKLSQKTKDYYSTIRALSAYISVVVVGFILIGLIIDLTWVKENIPYSELVISIIKYLGLFIGIFLIFLPIVAPILYKKIKLNILRRRKLSSIIIEKQIIIIDITDNGKKASYFNKIQIHKIDKNTDQFKTQLVISGTIKPDSLYASNCFYKIENGNKLTALYANSSNNLNVYAPLINGLDKCMTYSAILENTFLSKVENWDLIPIHYCINSILEIILPENVELKWVKFFKIIDGNEVEEESISPIVVTENNRQKIILQIINFDYGELLRLKWEIV